MSKVHGRGKGAWCIGATKDIGDALRGHVLEFCMHVWFQKGGAMRQQCSSAQPSVFQVLL